MIFWVIIAAAVFFVLSVWNQHRPHATDHPATCGDCGSSHPSFARYCRHCGRRME
ncbi:MAG TPA: hypothetical protein VFE58_08380 [Tepidisphaeraceae bacterium]|nr:hypothetical protein [Tepidisphaeraceae bacterium]